MLSSALASVEVLGITVVRSGGGAGWVTNQRSTLDWAFEIDHR
jgi:hypothetical protein